MQDKVNKVMGTITCVLGLGIAGAIMVGASQTPQATAANTSSVSRIERIVEVADIRFTGVYVLCHDGHEFLISTNSREINVTQVMARSSDFRSYPKGC